ncbi:hypothetical protein AHAS_Ahas20G0043700 [Arachis hypogaea]
MCVLPWCLSAQNSPEDYLEAHNTARAKVGIKPLKWDGRLESYAYLHLSQKTEHCIPIQSDGPYGENTVSGVAARGALRELTGAEAVVWRDTTHVGCARVQCDNGAYMVSSQNSPIDYLKAHNTARAKVRVKPLKWDKRLELYANLHLDKQIKHCLPIRSNGPFGENMASGVIATGPLRELTGAQAVNVVGGGTTHVGCARVQCNNGAYMVSCSLLCIMGYVYAHDSPKDYVDAHNVARSEVGEPSLIWDDSVAAYAQNYANQRRKDCQLIHSHGPYGENLAWSSSNDFSGVDAQNSPEDYLEAHNTARAKVKVKPLKWDWRLESYAYLHLSQKTEHCIPIQSDGPYGENTESGVTATGAFRKLTGAQAVGVWVAQKQYYDEKSNSCIGGYCRHYMQVVWRDTTHIGCARVQCEVGAYMVSCNYSPPGNLLDQRPY